ncbi:ABC transporter substrate-binding protein, partial [Flavobacteriaceae bacterium]|nr:ABC transporter substrate-binding protein [Flavobacteriaceae bacterium]
YNEQNNTARKKIYQILDSLVLENSPIIPLYYDKVMRFSQMNIEGLTTNPVNQLNLKKVYKK